MMNINKILKNKRLTLALIGLTPQEFLNLLPSFAQTWQDLKQEDYQKKQKTKET